LKLHKNFEWNSKTMSKPRISSDESVAGALFAELGKDNDDAAMEIMRSESLDSEGLPTPRTRVYIASGEWGCERPVDYQIYAERELMGKNWNSRKCAWWS
jgi:hypothetical protein